MNRILNVGDYRDIVISIKKHEKLKHKEGITIVAWRNIDDDMIDCVVCIHPGFEKEFEYIPK